MAQQKASPMAIVVAVVILILIIGGLWWKFLGPGAKKPEPLPIQETPLTAAEEIPPPAPAGGLPQTEVPLPPR